MTMFPSVIAVVAATFLAAPNLVHAQQTQQAAKRVDVRRSALEQGAVDAERAVLDALKAHDWPTFDRYVDGLMYLDREGIVPAWTKDRTAALKDLVTERFEITEVHTKTVAPNIVVLTYKIAFDQKYQGERAPSPVYAMSVWQRTGGRWRAIAHSESLARDAK
jgi:hypothetical protein